MEETSRPNEQIIELTQIVQEDQNGPETNDASIDDAKAPPKKTGDKKLPQTPSISTSDIPVDLMESVIEKWVEKEFQNKIEPLMQKVVERVLEREIRRIGQGIEEKIDKIQMDSSQPSKKD